MSGLTRYSTSLGAGSGMGAKSRPALPGSTPNTGGKNPYTLNNNSPLKLDLEINTTNTVLGPISTVSAPSPSPSPGGKVKKGKSRGVAGVKGVSNRSKNYMLYRDQSPEYRHSEEMKRVQEHANHANYLLMPSLHQFS